MKKILVCSCILLMVAGCASSPGQNGRQLEATDTYLGFTTKKLIQVKGAPSAVAVLPTGESVWTYKAMKTMENGKTVSWEETIRFIISEANTVKRYTTAVE